jgi:hypothetical protein
MKSLFMEVIKKTGTLFDANAFTSPTRPLTNLFIDARSSENAGTHALNKHRGESKGKQKKREEDEPTSPTADDRVQTRSSSIRACASA